MIKILKPYGLSVESPNAPKHPENWGLLHFPLTHENKRVGAGFPYRTQGKEVMLLKNPLSHEDKLRLKDDLEVIGYSLWVSPKNCYEERISEY